MSGFKLVSYLHEDRLKQVVEVTYNNGTTEYYSINADRAFTDIS